LGRGLDLLKEPLHIREFGVGVRPGIDINICSSGSGLFSGLILDECGIAGFCRLSNGFARTIYALGNNSEHLHSSTRYP
jgi:hypothetical protein